ncbi:MAG: protein kinase [Bryobacteraceae bacterium]
MQTCPSCSRECAENSRFCSWCSAPLDSTSAETAVIAPEPPKLSSTTNLDEGRFPPGTVMAGRYRIAGLLGRGGMGEVYRATDLTLGQAVALKFLPENLARDDRALARFYNEVRMARQVTHPNVCRVYDIGETGGLHYISMEYVDGEDLASLLRRIGRVPADKAIETARKLCAGLNAAHEKGVLHRDLKPANVMIDGRGHVIVMDFGLAGLSEQLQKSDIRSGTPAYMSPEQLAGTEVTAKSDIYALGLVLYELFTGKPAFHAGSLTELIGMQQKAAPASITSMVRDLDPAVERTILRCLQPDPRQRPASALAVAAGLPGGDPLAAALAAGETPSPELVAAAGETEGLRPKVAISWLAATLAAIAVIGVLGTRFYLTEKIPLDIPPEALARDARTLLKSLGYTARPADTLWGLDYNRAYQTYLDSHTAAAAARWKNPAVGTPPLIEFWYRESPRDMIAQFQRDTAASFTDPPMDVSGMLRLSTDQDGKLQELDAVPPQVEAPGATPAPPFDWALLLKAAGLDAARLETDEPRWTPLANWDSRTAWKTSDPQTGAALRIEAAQWRGRPVFFRIIGPWTKPDRMSAPAGGEGKSMVLLVVIYLVLISGCVIAWYNVRAQRADRRGATKLALIYFIWTGCGTFLLARHTLGLQEIPLFWHIFSGVAVNAAVLSVLYLALEPWVRRRWPQTLISWSRYAAKGIRDALVGRDILFGAGLGCAMALLKLLQLGLHGPSGEPVMADLQTLLGTRQLMATGLVTFAGALFDAIFFFFVLFIAVVLLRRQWLAAAAFIALVTVIFSAGTVYPWIDYPIALLMAGLYAFVLMRFGLLALVFAETLSDFLLGVPRTLDFSSWYAWIGMAPLLVVAAIAIFGFRTSLGGRPLLRDEMF